MELRPITLRAANAFVAEHHRHSRPTRGHRYSISAWQGETLYAVAIIGRPLARPLDDGVTAEVLRMCARPGAPRGINSMLYAASWKSWSAMGGNRMITYTLQTESGASLKGLKEMGWKHVADLDPRPEGWVRDDGATGKRENRAIYAQAKRRWEVTSYRDGNTH